MSPSPGTRVRVGSTLLEVLAEDRDLVWLAEFFRPALEVADGGGSPPAARVRLGRDPDRYARLRERLGSREPEPFEAFTLDGGFAVLPGFRDDRQWRWAFDARRHTFFGVDPTAREVDVLTESPAPEARLGLMRVVRELVWATRLGLGELPLHASGFVLGGRASLVCGRRRSGKTSLLIHALRGGADLLANDRILVASGVQPVARPVPTIVSIRKGTLERFEGCRERFDAARYDRARTIAECAPGIARGAPSTRREDRLPGISPAQLARLFHRELVGEAPIERILFASIDPAAEGLALEPLTREEGAREIEENRMLPSRPGRLAGLFLPVGADPRIPDDGERVPLSRLASAVQVFRCRIGRGAYAAPIERIQAGAC